MVIWKQAENTKNNNCSLASEAQVTKKKHQAADSHEFKPLLLLCSSSHSGFPRGENTMAVVQRILTHVQFQEGAYIFKTVFVYLDECIVYVCTHTSLCQSEVEEAMCSLYNQ